MADDRQKVIINVFTDPMLALSYESEPILRKLETHYKEQIEIRYIMRTYLDDVRTLASPDMLEQDESAAIEAVNQKLAATFKEEEAISHMPLVLDDFHLFSKEEDSSRTLNLACKAAQFTDPERADHYLYTVRVATLIKGWRTTRIQELLQLAYAAGIDVEAFLKACNDGTADELLDQDLAFGDAMGVSSLPAYLVQYGESGILMQTFRYNEFVLAIDQITEGQIQPAGRIQTADRTPGTEEEEIGTKDGSNPDAKVLEEEMETFLDRHPLITSVELQRAFDLESQEEVRNILNPLVESGTVKICEINGGWFAEKV